MRKVAMCSLLLVLVVTGCGGSKSKTTGTGGSGSGSANDAFSKLLEQQSKARIRVTYSSGSDSTFTVSQDGAGTVAYIDKDSVVISKGDTTTSCSGMPDNTECTTLTGDAGKAALAPFTAILGLAHTYIQAAQTSGGIGKASSETIAGRDATCTTITAGSALGAIGKAIAGSGGANPDAGFKTCADKKTGILLSWESVGTGSTSSDKLVATAVGDPLATDFTPPATTPPTTDTSGSEDTTTTESGGSTSPTTCATTATLPTGFTMPPGITLPCISG